MTYSIGAILLKVWMFTFVPVWIFLAVQIWKLKFRRDSFSEHERRWRTGLFICLIIFTIGTAHLGGWLSRTGAQQELKEAFATATQVVLNRKGKEPVAIDQNRLSKFRSMVLDSEGIMAHHSHPLGSVRFTFPPNPTVYSLARDSSVANEYWLDLCRDRWGWKGPTIKQFRSDELTKWLETNGLL